MMRPAFLTDGMRQREASHRRFILLGIGALLLLSLSPVFGHHLSTRLDAALEGQDHVWVVCMIALHTVLAPVHGLFHVLLAGGLVYAVWDRARAMRQVSHVLAVLSPAAATAPRAIQAAMTELGIDERTVRVVEGLPNPAFTAGWWSPRIYLAHALEDALTPAQLVAVLAHELEHVRRRDPLRLSALRFLGCTLFWIPAFRRLAADIADEAEIRADDAAAGNHPLVLASAILTMASWRGPSLLRPGYDVLPPGTVARLVESGARRSPAQSAAHDALLDRRVRRLAGETATVRSHLTWRSLAGAAGILSMVWLSGVAVAHPMPTIMSDAGMHCTHEGESPFTHVFCLLDDASAAHARQTGGPARACPHAG